MNTKNPTNSIEIPELLLKTRKLSPSAKLVRLILLMDAELEPRLRNSQTRLAARSGLSRPTIYKAMASLRSCGWYSEDKPYDMGIRPGRTVNVYMDPFLDKHLSLQARLLFHILLQYTLDPGAKAPQFRYSSLNMALRVGVNSLRRSVGQLVRDGWLSVDQVNRHAPIFFTVSSRLESGQSRMGKNVGNSLATEGKGDSACALNGGFHSYSNGSFPFWAVPYPIWEYQHKLPACF